MEIDKPPFSIVRNGWGEFDINITIYFQDINEEPVTKIHGIRIFHPNQNQRATLKKPVVNETYDEIVFVEPTEFFYHMLTEDPNETLKAAGILPADTEEKKEESKAETKEENKDDNKEDAPAEPKAETDTKEKEMEVDETAQPTEDKIKQEESKEEGADVEMTETDIKQEQNIKEENKDSNDDEIIVRSTYTVQVGANNEHHVDVQQFFEEHNDKSDLKLLNDALKHLKEETEYLRNEVRNYDKEMSEKKDKLRQYEQ